MDITFRPNKLKGNIKLITSKSFAHRMIICACFAEGKSVIKDVNMCDDVRNTINILRQIFDIKINKNNLEINGGLKQFELEEISITESASTLRLLLPLLAYYSKSKLTIYLGKRLKERGIEEYQKLYKNSNKTLEIVDNKLIIDSFPIENYYSVSSEKSSQYASGLILLASTLDQDTTINIKNYKNSLSYVDLTIEVVKMFGINAKREGSNVFVMHNQKLTGQTLEAPTDSSFALNMAVLNKFGSNIGYICPNFNKQDPDFNIYIDTLSTEIQKKEINLQNNPDSLLPLALLASKNEHPVVFKGINRLIYKESDRIQSLINFLQTINVKTEITDDNDLMIYPSEIKMQNISTFNDHRFAILAVILSTISSKEFTVYSFDSISKSYPNLLRDFESLGLSYKVEENIEKIEYKFDTKTTKIFASKNSTNLLKKYKNKLCKKVLIFDSKIDTEFVSNIAFVLGDNTTLYPLQEQGENNKKIDNVENLVRFLLENDIAKNDMLFALGGGSVLDFVGFVSSIYKRGVKFVSIPSTLLSMIDASIGGKNAVDIGEYKNMLGTFNNPSEIYVDFNALKSLPKHELKSGMAELIKIAALTNQNLFFEILDFDPYYNLEKWIIEAIKEKIKFIEIDPYDEGVRKALNFGHTYGHAIELLSNLSHGEAVAIGMAKESNNKLLKEALLKYGFNLELKIEPDQIKNQIHNDKKIENGLITLVDLKQIGSYNFIVKKL